MAKYELLKQEDVPREVHSILCMEIYRHLYLQN